MRRRWLSGVLVGANGLDWVSFWAAGDLLARAPWRAARARLFSPRTRSGRRILLVEDDRAVLAVLARILEVEGWVVVTAVDGDQALTRYDWAGPIDVLISDVVLPGTLQGAGVAAHLRASQEDLPVIFISGHLGIESDPEVIALPDVTLLCKPVSRAQLLDTVARVVKAKP